MGQQMPKVGDKIKIVKAYLTGGKYSNGDVLTVAEVTAAVIRPVEFVHWIEHSEFIILASPSTQPETYFVTIDGISTEVREVKREGRIGDYIKVTRGDNPYHSAGDVGVVVGYGDGTVLVDFNGKGNLRTYGSGLWYVGPRSCYANCGEYVVLEPTGVIQVDGTKYRKVTNQFPKHGDLVLVKANSDRNVAGKHEFDVPSIAQYLRPSLFSNHERLEQGYREQTLLRADIEFVVKVDEPAAPKTSTVESAPMPNVTDAKRAELQSKIDALTSELAKLPTTTATEQQAKREAAIAFAKQFVADIQDMGDKQNGNRKNLSLLVGSKYHDYYYRVSFETFGRTVKATVQTYTYFGTANTYFSPSVGTCVFSDGVVFNEHIAKAQALVSALGIKMPSELTNIPEPTVAKVGNVVKVKFDTWTATLTERCPRLDDYRGKAFRHTHDWGWIGTEQFDIVDDTNP